MDKIRQQIINILLKSQHILVMPSAPADGDSLGSALALYLALKKLDKQVTVVMAEPVPDAFQFLPTTNIISNEFSPGNDFIVTLDCEKAQIDTIKTKIEHDKVNIIVTAKKGKFSSKEVSFHHGPSKYDVIITVDTGDLSQLGRFYEDNTELFTKIPVINIDHHASNASFGKINLIDIMASATTELLIPFIEDLEKETQTKLMDEDIATLLLAGIVTDTGSFQNANTTPKSFASAAHLVKCGARQQEIIQHVFKTKHLSTLRLWGRILSNIKVDQKYRFVWSILSRKDFADTESREDETGGIIDELLTNAPGTEVVLLLKERADGVISGSIRTTNASLDASQIAGLFGGGGHVQAAGFKIETQDYSETERMIVEKVKEFQKQRLHIVDESDDEVLDSTFDQEKSQELQEKLSATVEKQLLTSREEEPEIEAMTGVDPEEEQTESFTDVIIRKGGKTETAKTSQENSQNEDRIPTQKVDHDQKTFTLEPNMTYKFEE